jgi:high-affinity nickel-transport protein
MVDAFVEASGEESAAAGAPDPARHGAFSLRALRHVFDDSATGVRTKVVSIYAFLGIATLAAWSIAFAAFASRPLLLGTALLAYTFGLRHAVDADHISAIDNVTRKLMQAGKRPVAVGFFFSLGHSTIVFALSLGIAFGATFVKTAMPELQQIGGLIGTSVSALFLFAIAILNTLVFLEVYAAFRRVKRGEGYHEESVADLLAGSGLMGRIFKPLLRLIGKSWHMYPLGILFGLGFDTATEVGLLGIAAVQGGNGLPIYDILIFPLLFMVGMSLLDTTDGILMLGAYGWAYVKPVRKLYYNMNVTLVSILVALFVGSVEALGIVAGKLNVQGGFWDRIGTVNENSGVLGFAIVALFLACWSGSTWIYKWRRYDELEAAVAVAADPAS